MEEEKEKQKDDEEEEECESGGTNRFQVLHSAFSSSL